MSEIPEPLDDTMLDGSERIRLARQMRDPITTLRTGPRKVWTTSIADIIRFARRVSTTVKTLTIADGRLKFTLTDGTVTDLGNVAGPAGATGAKGDKGDTGAKGDKGDTGAAGAPGAAGAKGADGGAGPQGSPGAAGAKGDPGAAGSAGAAGVAGAKGDTGPTGPAGSAAYVDLGVATISQTATLALLAGVRLVAVQVVGVVKDEKIVLCPVTPYPDGYLVGAPIATINGQLTVPVTAPPLAIGASYSIKVRVLAVR